MPYTEYTESKAISKLVENDFDIANNTIYGKFAKGSNGSGGALDYLLSEHKYYYFPNLQAPKKGQR